MFWRVVVGVARVAAGAIAGRLILQRYLNAEIAENAEGGWSNNSKAISTSGSQSMLFAVPLSLQSSAFSALSALKKTA